MPKTFTFPVWLQGTPEQQVAEQQRQDLARASFTRARLTDEERLIGRGVLLEETARANLAQATDEETRILSESQLADAVAMQGRYTEAAEIHPDEDRKAHFNNLVKALEMPDEEKCTCPDSTMTINNIELEVTPRFEEAKIFSQVHGGMVSVITCSKCGHSNARQPRSRLLPQQAALNGNEAAARAPKAVLVSDLQLLNAAIK